MRLASENVRKPYPFALQGAAVAAVLCALQQQSSRAAAASSDEDAWPRLRFAVLCSGFASPCPEHGRLLRAQAPLQLPSLHIYGANHHVDRQVRHLSSESCLLTVLRSGSPTLFCSEHDHLAQAGRRLCTYKRNPLC